METSTATSRFSTLSQKVEALYAKRQPGRSAWTDWLYPNHVVIVAANAKSVAERVGADAELSQVAALLHDIADIETTRLDSEHEEKSLTIARQVMKECGYSDDEIALVVDDAIRYHGCHGDERPANKEGLVLATADSMAHLQTDFYIFATRQLASELALEEMKTWALKKLERDYHSKVSFDDIRAELRADYELLKNLFSR